MSILDPQTLLAGMGPWALGGLSLMIFVESGLLFPFLPGDSLLVTAGLLHQSLGLSVVVIALGACGLVNAGVLVVAAFSRRLWRRRTPAAQAEAERWEAFRRFRVQADLSPRPLRFLARPEPIEDVFALVPDGPPVRFRWRRALHEVIAVEGPERIEGAWWSEEGGPARDYFRVEDKAVMRFWLFRAGLYRDVARALPRPRWFLHGLFG